MPIGNPHMPSKGSQRLADDHVAVDKLLKQVHAALNSGEVEASYAKIDLFWAKLAVHIRAEHLHLFPDVLDGVIKANGEHQSVAQVRSAIEQLRADHDFFMHELGNAIGMVRLLLKVSEQPVIDKELSRVKTTITYIEQRLANHNQLEESHVYRLAGIVLSPAEQAELAQRINSELENRPPRFTANIWESGE